MGSGEWRALFSARAPVVVGSATAPIAQEPTAGTLTSSGRSTERTDVIGAFADSLKLLLIEHGKRVAFQGKTRCELDGSFWSEYRWVEARPSK